MRKHQPAMLALIVSVVIVGNAGAQITLAPAPPQTPEFIAAADFNGDGRADAAVSSTGGDIVAILFGGVDGSFTPGVNVPVGCGAGAIAAGDLDGDAHPDFVVASHVERLLFVVSGNGDGTFNRPTSFEVRVTPDDVAIGNFDGKNGNDLVIVGDTSDRAIVLLNKGGNLGFASAGDFPTGNQPRRVVAADLNGDGLDDIVTLNTAISNTNTISVLLNTDHGSFAGPLNLAVSVAARDFTIADINNDGAPDILVLNGATPASPNTSSVSVLSNRTASVGGRTAGTGYFDSLPPVTISCPHTLAGIPIMCAPQSIAAADFDVDGLVDVAVSLETVPQVGTTAGLLAAFAGHGDGSFNFDTLVSIGSAPNRLVAADFNGDAIPDLAVTEDASQAVQIVLSVPPPSPIPDGCNVDNQCSSGFCIDHICCESATCPDGQFCNVPGSQGQCHVPLATPTLLCSAGARDAQPCQIQSDCPGGACVIAQGVCDDQNGYPCDCAGGTCSSDSLTCMGGGFAGQRCDTLSQCGAGIACIGTQKVCVSNGGTGDNLLGAGFSCLFDQQCNSSQCRSTGLVCGVGSSYTGFSCGQDTDCCIGGSTSPPGICGTVLPTATPTSTTPTPTPKTYAAEVTTASPATVRAASARAAEKRYASAGTMDV